MLPTKAQASNAARLAYEESPQGERLARHELACERRTHRCRDAFWKHRRESGDRTEDGGRRAEERRTQGGEDGGRRAEDGGGGGGGAENVADLRAESGVGEEGSSAPEKNLTSEPNVGLTASEAAASKEIAALMRRDQKGLAELSALRDLGIGTSGTPVGGGGKGLAAIEQAIFGDRPLLPPIS